MKRPNISSTLEALDDNRVKLSVEVDEAEFDGAIDAAFKRIAREVRMPGFRPGKAPRKLLEAQFGHAVGREEALREALPEYYAQAVVTHDVDVIAAPEIEITAGQDEGQVVFDAVVEVRPSVEVAGYDGLQVEIPSPTPSAEEIDEQLDRMRSQYAEFEPVDRPADDGDHVTIDIVGTHDGEEVPASRPPTTTTRSAPAPSSPRSTRTCGVPRPATRSSSPPNTPTPTRTSPSPSPSPSRR